MKLRVSGYEKAWAALLGGGTVTAATTLALWATSLTGAVEAPDAATIAAAVTGLVASLFAAAGAYIATNSPAEPTSDETPLPPPLQ